MIAAAAGSREQQGALLFQLQLVIETHRSEYGKSEIVIGVYRQKKGKSDARAG